MRRLLGALFTLLVLAHVARADEPHELTVFAAASLREAFEDLAKQLEARSPGLRVRLNFAGSQELRTQLEQGARADVFASADLKHMAALDKAGLLGEPHVFARNEPVVVVPKGNPAGVRSFADLPNARRLVIGAAAVPIGDYTRRIFDKADAKLGGGWKAKVLAKVASNELNVRQVLSKISLGEGDAGVVYRSDALAAKDKVEIVVIPPELNVIAEYPVAIVKGAAQPKAARAFVDLLLSAEGQKRLGAAGFTAPPLASK